MIPKNVLNVKSTLLNPRNLWNDPKDWDTAALKLAQKFIDNFSNFTDTEEGKRLIAAGPKVV